MGVVRGACGSAIESTLWVGFCPMYQESYRTLTLRSHSHTILCLGRNWQTTRFMEVEVAVRLLYMLAEALPVSHGAHFSGDVSKASALQDMMRTVGILRVLPRKHICPLYHAVSSQGVAMVRARRGFYRGTCGCRSKQG